MSCYEIIYNDRTRQVFWYLYKLEAFPNCYVRMTVYILVLLCVGVLNLNMKINRLFLSPIVTLHKLLILIVHQ